MDFQLPISISPLPEPIGYADKIMLTGSCFTEHIGNALRDWKFDVLQNPNGILFDPASVASSLVAYMDGRPYGEGDLVYFNELWQSWQHHSQFSHVDKQEALRGMNDLLARLDAYVVRDQNLVQGQIDNVNNTSGLGSGDTLTNLQDILTALTTLHDVLLDP